MVQYRSRKPGTFTRFTSCFSKGLTTPCLTTGGGERIETLWKKIEGLTAVLYRDLSCKKVIYSRWTPRHNCKIFWLLVCKRPACISRDVSGDHCFVASVCIQLFRDEKLTGECVKPTRQDRMAVWVVIGILRVVVEESTYLYVFTWSRQG